MKLRLLLAAAAACAVVVGTPADARDRWTKAQAEQWYDAQPWMVGSNYNPATAINQLEMWQAATFDPATIDTELGRSEEHTSELQSLMRRSSADFCVNKKKQSFAT